MADGFLNDLLGLLDGFGAARENRDRLAHLARLLRDCEPSLLVLADAGKRLLAADDTGNDDPDESECLAQELVERCPAREMHMFDMPTAAGLRLGFGLRLPAEAEHGVLAGLVQRGKTSEQFLATTQDMLTAYGALALVACRSSADKLLLQTQIQHLVAERDVLRMSHSEAITVAVAEREQRLREQQEHVGRLQAVMMTAADGLITFCETGTIESFNEAAGCIFGYEPGEAIGQNIAILLPPSGCEPYDNPIATVPRTANGAAANSAREVIGRRKDGSTFPLELAVSEVSLDDRRIRTAILRDITARKQAEEQLRRLHVQNNAILNSAGEGIVGTDRQGKAVFANPAGALMLGWESRDLVGQRIDELFYHATPRGQRRRPEECPIHKTLRDGVQRRADHAVFSRKDGSHVPVEYTVTPIWEEGEIVGSVLTFRDISERKALERQLIQAQKLESIGQLAAGIAHEINTPIQYIGDNTRFLDDVFQDLTALLTCCDELCDAARQQGHVPAEMAERVAAAAADADLRYALGEIPKAIGQSLEGVGRVAKIVRSMKEFSHPGGEHMQAIDLNRALESTLTVSRNEWKYVADAVTKFDPALPPVSCLPGECNQVFLNLIINAAHAIADKLGKDTDRKGTITVSTRRDGEFVEIRVEDTGTGIPEEFRSRVLDPFFTTKEVGRGTGQGLAIAHSVVTEKHGGTLAFETEVGQGTTFIVRLPIFQDSTFPKDATHEPAAASVFK